MSFSFRCLHFDCKGLAFKKKFSKRTVLDCYGPFFRHAVVVLTAYSSPDIEEECLRQEATAVLEKLLNTEQLLDAVEKALASQKIAA